MDTYYTHTHTHTHTRTHTHTHTASQVALVVKNLPVSAGDARDMGSISGMGRLLGEGNGSPPLYSCLENSMEREVWQARQATLHAIPKSWKRLSR